jgi:hypothetical protein
MTESEWPNHIIRDCCFKVGTSNATQSFSNREQCCSNDKETDAIDGFPYYFPLNIYFDRWIFNNGLIFI